MLFGFFVLGLNVDSPMADFRHIMFTSYPTRWNMWTAKKQLTSTDPPCWPQEQAGPLWRVFARVRFLQMPPPMQGEQSNKISLCQLNIKKMQSDIHTGTFITESSGFFHENFLGSSFLFGSSFHLSQVLIRSKLFIRSIFYLVQVFIWSKYLWGLSSFLQNVLVSCMRVFIWSKFSPLFKSVLVVNCSLGSGRALRPLRCCSLLLPPVTYTFLFSISRLSSDKSDSSYTFT